MISLDPNLPQKKVVLDAYVITTTNQLYRLVDGKFVNQKFKKYRKDGDYRHDAQGHAETWLTVRYKQFGDERREYCDIHNRVIAYYGSADCEYSGILPKPLRGKVSKFIVLVETNYSSL